MTNPSDDTPRPAVDHQFRGGLRWGESYWIAKNVTWPFATLTVRADAIQIQSAAGFPFGVFDANFVLSHKDVISLRVYRGFLSRGIQVEHLRSDIPPFVVFWSFGCGEVLAMARAAGFRVSD